MKMDLIGINKGNQGKGMMEVELERSSVRGQNSLMAKGQSNIGEQPVEIVFKLITKEGRRQNMRFIIDLKNIFARQLPKMPKEYIVKLVLDQNHESIVIVKNNTQIIGGICFRSFQNVPFIEIAFLAISSTEQVKGYGTQLMNRLKEQMQNRKIQSMMTFADNLALGFFKKQGFSSQIRMAGQAWKGKIKDYEGGTIMECYIHPSIDYSKIGQILTKQKNFVFQKIKEVSLNKTIFKGQVLSTITSATHKSSSGFEYCFKRDPLLIPGIKQSGWSWEDHQYMLNQRSIPYPVECQKILQLLKKHPSSWPFRQPVNQQNTPDYILIIPYPMDLKTIEKKLNNKEYINKTSFCQDIRLMFQNCRKYNVADTEYWRCAMELQEYIKIHLKMLQEETVVKNQMVEEGGQKVESGAGDHKM